MSNVAHDYAPAQMTPGELAAIADANERGWISPPVYCSWHPEPPRAWRSVHQRYLERRGLIAETVRRIDGLTRVRLNAAGMKLRAELRLTTNKRELYALAGVVLP